MISTDEDALICDLAETYHIYDYKQLPLSKVAVFSCGLMDNSRIKMKMSDQSIPLDTLLIAGISDKLSLLLWTKTKDGMKGINKPSSILNILTGSESVEKKEIAFDSGEDFERMRKQLIMNSKIGGEIDGN